MRVTLRVRPANSDSEVKIEFDKAYDVTVHGQTAAFYVYENYTASENANEYNASTVPYRKLVYDVIECRVQE